LRIEEITREPWSSATNIDQFPALGGLMRSTMTLNSVDPLPFWMYGGVLAPLSDPPVLMLRLLTKMEKGPMSYQTKLTYRERNLLDQALSGGLVERGTAGWILTPQGRKLYDSFGSALNNLVDTIPHFHVVPAPLVTFW
jgi:hypothetical protein